MPIFDLAKKEQASSVKGLLVAGWEEGSWLTYFK